MKAKRSLLICGIACAMVSLASFSVSAYSGSLKYDTNSRTIMKDCENTTSTSSTIYANTRPSTGSYGAYVTIELNNGTVVAAKTFPFYSSTSDLTATLPGNAHRYVYIAPAYGSQNIKGNLALSY